MRHIKADLGAERDGRRSQVPVLRSSSSTEEVTGHLIGYLGF